MTDQAHPATEEARATDAGIRWLRRRIAEAWARHRAQPGESVWLMIWGYHQELYGEALEHRIRSWSPEFFDRRPYVP